MGGLGYVGAASTQQNGGAGGGQGQQTGSGGGGGQFAQGGTTMNGRNSSLVRFLWGSGTNFRREERKERAGMRARQGERINTDTHPLSPHSSSPSVCSPPLNSRPSPPPHKEGSRQIQQPAADPLHST